MGSSGNLWTRGLLRAGGPCEQDTSLSGRLAWYRYSRSPCGPNGQGRQVSAASLASMWSRGQVSSRCPANRCRERQPPPPNGPQALLTKTSAPAPAVSAGGHVGPGAADHPCACGCFNVKSPGFQMTESTSKTASLTHSAGGQARGSRCGLFGEDAQKGVSTALGERSGREGPGTAALSRGD